MQFKKSSFLNKSVSLITAVGLTIFGGVTATPAGAQGYCHHSYDQSEEFHQVQEYRRLQKARRLQTFRRKQNYRQVQNWQRSPQVQVFQT